MSDDDEPTQFVRTAANIAAAVLLVIVLTPIAAVMLGVTVRAFLWAAGIPTDS